MTCEAGCDLAGVEVGTGVPMVLLPGLRVDPGLGDTVRLRLLAPGCVPDEPGYPDPRLFPFCDELVEAKGSPGYAPGMADVGRVPVDVWVTLDVLNAVISVPKVEVGSVPVMVLVTVPGVPEMVADWVVLKELVGVRVLVDVAYV